MLRTPAKFIAPPPPNPNVPRYAYGLIRCSIDQVNAGDVTAV